MLAADRVVMAFNTLNQALFLESVRLVEACVVHVIHPSPIYVTV